MATGPLTINARYLLDFRKPAVVFDNPYILLYAQNECKSILPQKKVHPFDRWKFAFCTLETLTINNCG